MAKSCLVTGAAGFIGSHLVDKLLAQGCRVLGVDNMVLGKKANIADALKSPNFIFQELDVNDLSAGREFLKAQSRGEPIETLWHLAANSDIQAGGANPDIDLERTFLTTYNTLKLMQEFQIPKIVFASTSAIYGELGGALTELSGPLHPISNYGAMKLASEGIITAALERFLKQAWIYRFPNVVGSRATHGAIYDFLKKLKKNPAELEVLGDGSQEKPYLHVGELVDAMTFLFQNQQKKLNVFNISPEGSASTVKFMAEATVRLAAPGAKIRYTGGSKGWVGDVSKFQYSIEKLKAAGWKPRLTSNETVELAIKENLANLN
ncbi:MAG TPA: NAD-dependent epimerase/dehydratase family protein [Candidatus Polarisedimenticolia bacterium]|nr:NAD-dependent epimerase/dehydratase family protein [Candidatus Polarisedimenticolia bacterium]